jgi:3-isopropylmalate dehydrogenase
LTTYRIGLAAGDGIGPEISSATHTVMDAACKDALVSIDWVEAPIGFDAIASYGDPIPAETKSALASCDGFVLGPHDSASYPEEYRERRNPSGELRTYFDLYANIRPARAHPAVPAVSPRMDLVLVRENTEGFYTDRNMYVGTGELMPTVDVALAVGVFTRPAIMRAAHEACRLAMRRRRRLTIVHKANILRRSSGLFLQVCREVGSAYPDLSVDDFHIDAMTAHLVRRGDTFDVVVAENMFGDILSDLAGELSGSLGLAGSLNAGTDHAMAQAAHGSAPDIAGQGVANPIGLLLSAAMLLRWLGDKQTDPRLTAAGDSIDVAVDAALTGGIRTRDLRGDASTAEFTEAVVERLLAERSRS